MTIAAKAAAKNLCSPAKAGAHHRSALFGAHRRWVPAFAGTHTPMGRFYFAGAAFSAGNLRYMNCCCAIDRQLFVIQ